MIRIIQTEPGAQAYRAPDLVRDGYSGDLAINSLLHPDAPGDFRSEQGLATQVFICLMSDRRVESSELRDGDENRGWIGDSYDTAPNEGPIGSKLWLLRRAALHDGVEGEAEDYAREALQTLIDQGAVARIDVSAVADRVANTLFLSVSLYGREGAVVYQSKFEILWRQIDGVVNPLAR